MSAQEDLEAKILIARQRAEEGCCPTCGKNLKDIETVTAYTQIGEVSICKTHLKKRET